MLHARESSTAFHPQSSNGHGSAASHPGTEHTDAAAAVENDGHERLPKKPRKHRVIIHTSPYLRCLQTSVAISAGMAQYRGAFQASEGGNADDEEATFQKPLLRIDACLGEWLNPDYFEFITSPPDSVRMVAGAKAALLRGGEDSGCDLAPSKKVSLGFPGGWGCAIESDEAYQEEARSTLSALAPVLPRRDRTSSHGGAVAHPIRSARKVDPLLNGLLAPDGGYVAPTPSYAIRFSAPIPAGYVAHARDACLEVDYQWDSMREPQCWGDGGEYGEEWSAMHRRCRSALQKMLSWYKAQDAEEARESARAVGRDEHEHDSDAHLMTDTVLILVSHGATCNAFLGGLTDSPVLMDIGMASLTLALRRDRSTMAASTSQRPSLSRRKSWMAFPASEHFEVQLVASTEHLRAGTSHLTLPQLQTSTALAGSSNRHQPRRGAGAGSRDEASAASDRAPRSRNSSALGSVRRGVHASSSSPLSRESPSSVAVGDGDGSNGLWSRPTSADAVGENHLAENIRPYDTIADDHMVLKVNQASHDFPPRKESASPFSHRERINGHGGLWCSSPEVLRIIEKEQGAKRRWTVNEQVS
ncbi:MAG: hypothetical protein M1826_002124 [Phylliscum demangeonii]|nr:MAG: hypothetical protein M1826_002124 [Phylliscum demangeonii]